FELGGDSIKALQVSSRLLQAGYRMEMKDLFSHPTVISLSPLLRTDGKIASQEDAKGRVELTPIQRWFFEQQPAEPHHNNQAMLLYRAERFNVDALRHTMDRIVQHHDALRTVFRDTEHGYEAWNRETNDGVLYTLEIVDLLGVADEALAVETKATEIQGSIQLSEGPLVKLGLFQCAQGDHLLIVIHHLVVDGVSWRILLEDVAAGYEQALAGKKEKAIQLPHKSDSFQTWAGQLSAYANSAAMEQELAYWQHIEQAEAKLVQALPKDFDQPKAQLGDSEVITVRWTKQETDMLLKQAHRAYSTEMNDLLLSALGKAIFDWSGSERVLINLEGHGRESILPDMDVTRTIGWFTSQFPVVLNVSAASSRAGADQANIGRLITQVKEGLRQIPNKGIGYGILRYLSNSATTPTGGLLQIEPEISFNYLGQFDQDYKGSALQPSSYSIGVPVSTKAAMDFALDINGLIEDGELVFTIRYGSTQFRQETMERLGEHLVSSLREVILHCVAQDRTVLTPSDVLLNNVTMDELQQLVEDTRELGELENVYALTPMQKGMLFYSLMDADSGAYFEQATFELNGRFDVGAFGRSFDLLIERHEALRTNFISLWKDEPVQAVFRSRSGQLYYEDLRELSVADREARVEAYTGEDKAKGFRLDADALIRVSILQTGDEAYHFIWSFHHILMDGWCLSFMTQEVFGTYLALRAGQEPMLSPVTPFSRFIEWLERQDREEARQYWSGYLADYEQQVMLPQQKVQSTSVRQKEYAAGELECDLQPELAVQIGRVAKQHQVTINTLIQTVWGVLLQKYNNSTDVVFGSVVSGRPSDIPGVEQMIGLFINTIPVRIQTVTGEGFATLMRRVQEQALASNTYDAFPLYEIQSLTDQKQDLINHIMVFENYPVEQQVEQLGDSGEDAFTISNVVATEQTNYDLNVVVMPGEAIRIRFMYNALSFDQAGIERLHGHFAHLLEQIALNPQARIDELELITAAEQSQIREVFNNTATAYPRHQSIHRLFEEQAARVPEKTAAVYGQQSLSYRELNESANRLAHTLRLAGVQADEPVGLLAERSLDMLIGTLAILKAGGAYVPIDPQYPEERIRYMLEDSGARLLLAQEALLERYDWTGFTGQIVELNDEASRNADTLNTAHTLNSTDISSNTDTLNSELTSNLPSSTSSHDAAYIIYTSGSTGLPKGVVVEHRSVVRLVCNTDYVPLDESTRILQTGALVFDASTFEIWGALLNGGQLVLVDQDTLLDAAKLKTSIREHAITTMWMTAPLFNQLSQQDAELFGAVKYLLVGGDVLSVPHINRVLDHHPGLTIINGYGPTENTTFSTTYRIDELQHDAVPIGRPIHNSTAYVVDAGFHLQPIGAWGELVVGGDGVARGYLNRPELTSEKFRLNPWAAGADEGTEERLYCTGDLVRWREDGTLEYAGRMDQQVKIRGYRIELGEIEAKLLRMVDIREAVVLVIEDEDGQKMLCAYFTSNQACNVGELRQVLTQELPSYMVPSYFMQVEQIPLTVNGKVDRKALPAPEGGMSNGTAYVSPRTAAEQALATVWSAVLGGGQIGILDHFFELGGDSIKAIQVASRLLQAGYKMDMKDLFKYPTIKDLAPQLGLAERHTADQGVVTGEVVLTPIQHWFVEQKQPDDHHFNQAVMLHREQGFDEGALLQALAKLAEHHDALRMVFSKHDHSYSVQNRGIDEGELFHLEVADFRDVSDSAVLRAAIEAKADSIQSGINLDEGPLFRAGLFRCADGDHLLLVIHHLVVDGVSWRILFEDLATVYEQAVSQEALRLPYKTDSFRTWSHQLTEYAHSEAMVSERDYWERLNAEALDNQGKLPMDAEVEGPFTLADTDTVVVQLTQPQTEQLLKQAHRAYNTEVNDLLLTALGMTLQAWTGHERSLINLEGHGREDILAGMDVSRTVGWFTTQYPVLLDAASDSTLSARIKQVKESLRHIPNKGIGYGIWRYLTEARTDLRQSEGRGVSGAGYAEPQISFNYLGQFDQDLSNSNIRMSPYSIGAAVSERTEMKYMLDVGGIVTDGVLELEIRYNREGFRQHTIQMLAELLRGHLLEIIEHCVSRERTELTPSDVLFKGLTLEQLATILDQTQAVGELENVYPLTPMQKGMLFHSLMHAETGVYFEQATFELNGAFVPEVFEKSLALLIDRHAIFRTNFYSGWHGQPLQVVYRYRAVDFQYEDVREGRDAVAEIVAEYISRDKARGFDLGQDSLMRVAVLRTGDSTYQFIWSFHHIVMDGWCLSLVTDEVFGAYQVLLAGKEPVLAAVQPYSNYIEWLERQNTEAASRYWSDYLAGFEQQTLLPGEQGGGILLAEQNSSQLAPEHVAEQGTEHGSGAAGYTPGKLSFTLGQQWSEALNRMARQQQVTINTVLQTVWGVILQNYNNNQDVVFGSVVSGRPAEIAGVEQMIGLFINTIPVRIMNERSTTFAQLLHSVQEQALASGAYDTFPLYEIQALTEQKQDLINHIMVFENFPIGEQISQVGDSEHGSEHSGSALSITNVSIAEQTNYDFNLIVVPGEDISILFEYNTLVYSLADVERIQGHIDQVIGQIVANPHIRVDELALVTPAEQAHLIEMWGDTAAPYPQEETLSSLFEQQVLRSPEQVAVICGEQSLTYAELNERANRLARTLRAEGVVADQPVGVVVQRSLEMMVGIYAILKAGGAYVPIDPDYPADRIRFMLEDSGAQLVLTQQHLVERWEVQSAQSGHFAASSSALGAEAGIVSVSGTEMASDTDAGIDGAKGTGTAADVAGANEASGWADFGGKILVLEQEELYHEDGSNLAPLAGPQHIAYVIYTSGSTGKPKGVMVEHHSVINRILWMHDRYGLSAEDTILQKTTFTFDVSVWELFWWSMVGSKVSLLSVGGEKNP
ncbi:non-ribosomal peptide synthetase, partial [Paenibacillus massiliensis]|uniref:non-ribosomal peptide synthetase n=1 Tax=Paenibacillus massiliensis TaxID=225917 RepID=UPI00035F1819